uniref:Uncharacterized protein n=1 Tax=Triticum urartu TaxID=4572 RepID=A0A8R7TSN6_TRIUA
MRRVPRGSGLGTAASATAAAPSDPERATRGAASAAAGRQSRRKSAVGRCARTADRTCAARTVRRPPWEAAVWAPAAREPRKSSVAAAMSSDASAVTFFISLSTRMILFTLPSGSTVCSGWASASSSSATATAWTSSCSSSSACSDASM